MKPREQILWLRYLAVTVILAALGAAVGWIFGAEMPLDGVIYDASLALTEARPGTRDEPVAVPDSVSVLPSGETV